MAADRPRPVRRPSTASLLNWEAAYAKKYRIEVSDDGTNFTTAATVDSGDGKTDDLTA